MITAPGTIMIIDRQSAGSPRDRLARAVSAGLGKITVVDVVRDVGRAHQRLPGDAPDSPGAAMALSANFRERDRPILKHP